MREQAWLGGVRASRYGFLVLEHVESAELHVALILATGICRVREYCRAESVPPLAAAWVALAWQIHAITPLLSP